MKNSGTAPQTSVRKYGTRNAPTHGRQYTGVPEINYQYGEVWGGSVAEWLASWTHAQKGPGSNRSRDTVG